MSEERKWTSADVNVVELLALGFGLMLGGGAGLIGLLFASAWLPVGILLGGMALITRAIFQGRRRPWWRIPGEGPR